MGPICKVKAFGFFFFLLSVVELILITYIFGCFVFVLSCASVKKDSYLQRVTILEATITT